MRKPKSFKTKLWLYFALFAAIIFSLLWLLQTVFLQSFYNQMLIRNTKKAAQTIIQSADDEDINSVIDKVAHDNSLLIYVTDTNGEPLYFSDEYKSAHRKKENSGSFGNGGRQEGKHKGNYRNLPESYDEFLAKLNASETDTTELQTDDLYVYGANINYNGTECVLYVSATLNAVGSAVTIIRYQLAVVTGLSLVIGFVLAWLIAKRFSKPVSRLSDKAKLLGEENYSEDFKKGFCAELDELSDTLDKTSEKLRQSKNYQNELLSNVSHDLRTPLTMIKGYAEEIGDYSWQDEKQRNEDVAVIMRETDRLTALVNEILEYSELQAQDDAKDFQHVDLSALVTRVTDNFASLYKREGYTFERKVEENIAVNGSAQKLERAVVNLLDNAVRHAGKSKTVTVKLFSDNGARLEIVDDGDGIAEEDLPHIWEKYYTSRQRSGKGASGLGLAIVKQIVLLHNGSCSVTTKQNEGSAFVIVLPR